MIEENENMELSITSTLQEIPEITTDIIANPNQNMMAKLRQQEKERK
jgi:hypothetical protein